jgi:hypothetical protein
VIGLDGLGASHRRRGWAHSDHPVLCAALDVDRGLYLGGGFCRRQDLDYGLVLALFNCQMHSHKESESLSYHVYFGESTYPVFVDESDRAL